MFEELKQMIVAKLNVSPELVSPEASFDEMDLDSLALVELSLLLEKELEIHVSDDELRDAKTLGRAAQLLVERAA
ncbi:phosphopantetheine-binding protein [Streptomyces sp. NPDC098077]|uniref:phosphopantetheine-binding protein n=1 Tax=Streptomyces sp. NPDC098077 TaxID=3366093 RepID=UPI0037F8D0E5